MTLFAWFLWIAALATWLKQLRYHQLVLRITRAVWWRRPRRFRPLQQHSFILLVPAHNEEAGIEATLASLKALDYPPSQYEILVIADNCSDQTADRARALGVSVIERQDPHKKSKGFALEYAIAQIAQRPQSPDALVIIDADTRVEPHLLSAFSSRLRAGQKWQQAYYSVSNAEENLRTRMLTYALALFNGSWLLGQDGLGLSCALRGNGMCFAWSALKRCPWQAYGLAEDLEFSWHLRLAGERVHFVHEARVFGEMIAGAAQAAVSQRLRWEHGRKALKAAFGPRLAQLPRRQRSLLQADLSMPPLSRYVSWLLLGFLLGMAAASLHPLAEIAAIPLTLVTISGTVFFFYLLSPFVRLGLPLRFAWALFQAPFYMLWKLRLLRSGPPQTWDRAQRNTVPEESSQKAPEK